ncbi:MAG: T9SS type A sorting domain-containing protein [Bacteroidales bacterium]|nr:T9SS type A sorting domain-containing protein [Bacteroidales bacterium]
MKKTIISFLLLFLAIPIYLKAQPQWKFHLAFEDATGAKDTIWFIWDTTATFYGLDTALGEYPVSLDDNLFNVWICNPANEKYDTLKTIAHPYTYTFGHQIEAVNFKLPVKISWDSSLFHADWLPSEPVGWVNNAWISNEYFFLVNNTEDHYFDLTLDNHTIMPDSTIVGTADENPWFWLPERNFPLGIGLAQDPTLYVDEDLTRKDYFIYPNPVHSLLIVDTQKKIATVKILNTQGKCLQVIKAREFPLNIDFSGFDRGIYVIQLISNQNQYYHEKIIKAN